MRMPQLGISDITDIILQDIITDLRVITAGITDITDTVTDITGTDTATDITDTDILITIMEEDKKSGIFWKINFLNVNAHTNSSNMDLIELVQQNLKFVVDVIILGRNWINKFRKKICFK